MPDIDYSFLDDDLLIELSQLELDDYIIELAWSSNGENLAVITVEGKVFLINKYADITKYKLIGQHDKEAIQFHGGRMERNSQQLVMTEKSKYGMEFPAMKLSRLKLEIHGFLKQFIIHTAIGWLRQQEGNLDCGTPIIVFYESSDHSSTIADLGWSPDGSGVAVAAYNGVTLHVPHKQKHLGNTVGRDLV